VEYESRESRPFYQRVALTFLHGDDEIEQYDCYLTGVLDVLSRLSESSRLSSAQVRQ
jgi:hypothetical protein